LEEKVRCVFREKLEDWRNNGGDVGLLVGPWARGRGEGGTELRSGAIVLSPFLLVHLLSFCLLFCLPTWTPGLLPKIVLMLLTHSLCIGPNTKRVSKAGITVEKQLRIIHSSAGGMNGQDSINN